jgi:tRNA(fMet)-specific endonuclease VapC
MRYLLDSNILIGIITKDDRILKRRMNIHREDVALSSIVFHELYYGAFFSGQVRRNLEAVDALAFPVLDFDRHDARAAGEVRAALRRAGTPIGPYDSLIAGQALARGLTLVTGNVAEFSRVPSLPVEDWRAGAAC